MASNLPAIRGRGGAMLPDEYEDVSDMELEDEELQDEDYIELDEDQYYVEDEDAEGEPEVVYADYQEVNEMRIEPPQFQSMNGDGARIDMMAMTPESEQDEKMAPLKEYVFGTDEVPTVRDRVDEPDTMFNDAEGTEEKLDFMGNARSMGSSALKMAGSVARVGGKAAGVVGRELISGGKEILTSDAARQGGRMAKKGTVQLAKNLVRNVPREVEGATYGAFKGGKGSSVAYGKADFGFGSMASGKGADSMFGSIGFGGASGPGMGSGLGSAFGPALGNSRMGDSGFGPIAGSGGNNLFGSFGGMGSQNSGNQFGFGAGLTSAFGPVAGNNRQAPGNPFGSFGSGQSNNAGNPFGSFGGGQGNSGDNPFGGFGAGGNNDFAPFAKGKKII
jgi:hypothetical protein